MADTRAARANRCVSGRATTEPATGNTRGCPRAGHTAERATDEPHVEHPGEDDDYVDANADRNYREDHGEDAESSHLSQRPNASAQERHATSPATALLMAEELLRYRPSADAQDNWQGRLQHLIGIATSARAAPAQSLSLVHHNSGRTSPRDCQIVQRTAPDARVDMERQKDLHNRISRRSPRWGNRTAGLFRRESRRMP